MLGVQNSKTRETQKWSFYFEPPLFGPENISGAQTIGPIPVDSKNGFLIHLIVNTIVSPQGGSEFGERTIQPYFRATTPGPKPKLDIYQSRTTLWGNRKKLNYENIRSLLLQKYKH